MEKKSTETKHKLAFIVFLDPMYKSGWTERKDLPENKDALHIGCGVVVREDDKTITLALAEELYDTTSDVMHPQLIHKDCIVQLYTFTEGFIYEVFKSRTPKRIRSQIRRDIDYKIQDFC